jgi:hypothetical protein
MVSRRRFIRELSDDSSKILSAILKALPNDLPLRTMRVIKANKWRTIKLTPASQKVKRKTLAAQIGLTVKGMANFQQQAGSYESFCHLLERMLAFENVERWTVQQCLAHPFFAEYQTLIEATRVIQTNYIPPEEKLVIYQGIERDWMYNMVVKIYNDRESRAWYDHRSLFQAMDLSDRYLSAMATQERPDNLVASDIRGLIHDQFETELRFMACYYLAVKYFSCGQYALSYDNIIDEEYRGEVAKVVVEQFESTFLIHCLDYHLYRPTLYETADSFGHKLDEDDVQELLLFCARQGELGPMTAREMYSCFLRQREVENL